MIKKLINKVFNIYKDAMSFQAGMDLAELPVVTFYQGEQKINFLLDTGSNNCVIDSTFLKKIKHTMCDTQTNLTGLEGNTQRAGICIIEMSYKDKSYKSAFVVQDLSAAFNSIKQETGVTIHGMLGSKFFNAFKYVLDFDELIAYSKE